MTIENEGVQDNNQNAGNQNQGEAVKSAYDLYDAADQAYEAYQANPENEELKTAYDTARKTAKETAGPDVFAASFSSTPRWWIKCLRSSRVHCSRWLAKS